MSESCKDAECSRQKPYGILAKIDDKELKKIKVTIKMKNIPNRDSLSPLRRDLVNAETLRIHLNGKKPRCIFDHSGVLVNRVILEDFRTHKRSSNTERTYRRSPLLRPGQSRRSRSKEYKRRSRSPHSRARYSSSLSSSERYRSHRSNTPKDDSDHHHHRSKTTNYHRELRSPSLRPGQSEGKEYKRRSRSPHSRSSHPSPSERYRPHRSISPKNHSDYHHHHHQSKWADYPLESRSPDRDYSRRYSRSHSPPLRPGEYKTARRTSRERSKSPPSQPSEYRSSRRSPSKKYEERTRSTHSKSHSSRSPSRSHLFDMRHSDYEMYKNPNFAPMFRLPHFCMPQYIPYPAMPVRPPLIRPPKIYNTRTIPNLVSTITSTGRSANTTGINSEN